MSATIVDVQARQILDSRGGLLSLVGTNDFYAMIGFLRQGATPVQRKKIELVQNFLARKKLTTLLI